MSDFNKFMKWEKHEMNDGDFSKVAKSLRLILCACQRNRKVYFRRLITLSHKDLWRDKGGALFMSDSSQTTIFMNF